MAVVIDNIVHYARMLRRLWQFWLVATVQFIVGGLYSLPWTSDSHLRGLGAAMAICTALFCSLILLITLMSRKRIV